MNKIIKPIKNIKLYIITIGIITVFTVINSNFKGIEELDTTSYLDIVKNGLNSDAARFRPILYPLLLKLSFFIEGKTTYFALVFLQILFFSIASCVFLFLILNDKTISKIDNKIISLILILSLISPQVISYISVVLPETVPLLFYLIIVYFTIKNINNYFEASAFGFFIVIPILFKPLWLFFIAFPIAKLFWIKSIRNTLFLNIFVPIFVSVLIYGSYQFSLKVNNGEQKLPTTMDVNLNLALIRAGVATGAEETKLYKFLESKKLITEIKNRKWDNSEIEYKNFTSIKDSIPWEYREDKQYWKKALLNNKNLFKFCIVQLKRTTKFYTNSASFGFLKFENSIIEYVYKSFYNHIHKIFVIPIFVLLFFRILLKKERPIIIVFWLSCVLASIVLAFLTYQDPHFSRMRTILEPIILFITLYGLYISFIYIKNRLNVFQNKHFKNNIKHED